VAICQLLSDGSTDPCALRRDGFVGLSLAKGLLRKARRRSRATIGAEHAGIQGGDFVANIKETLSRIMQVDGAVGACIVDSNSGMMLGAEGGGIINLEIAAAGNTEVVRSKRKTMRSLNLKDSIEDILITLHSQYHLIRPLSSNDALFIYLVLDKTKGNLAMARHQLAGLEKDLAV
jgi:hypothetical protein